MRYLFFSLIVITQSLLFAQSETSPSFDTQLGTRYVYLFNVVTEAGREEYGQKMVVTDYGDKRIEFYYETASLNAKEGKIVMKKKGIWKGKWDERLVKGGDKTLRKQTAYWLSRKQYANVAATESFNWGRKGNIRYVKKADIIYNVQFNDAVVGYPAYQLVWEGNTKYKMVVLANPLNPLILSNEYLDAENNPCFYRLTEVTKPKDLPYQKMSKEEAKMMMKQRK